MSSTLKPTGDADGLADRIARMERRLRDLETASARWNIRSFDVAADEVNLAAASPIANGYTFATPLEFTRPTWASAAIVLASGYAVFLTDAYHLGYVKFRAQGDQEIARGYFYRDFSAGVAEAGAGIAGQATLLSDLDEDVTVQASYHVLESLATSYSINVRMAATVIWLSA